MRDEKGSNSTPPRLRLANASKVVFLAIRTRTAGSVGGILRANRPKRVCARLFIRGHLHHCATQVIPKRGRRSR